MSSVLLRSVLAAASLAMVVPQPVLAGSRSATMGVSVVVQRTAIFRVTDTFQQIRAADVDFSRGYVDLPGTVQVLVNSGGSARRVVNVTVEVEPNPDLVRAIQMLARTEQAPAAGDNEGQNIALGYRVLLTDRARTGNLSVPVTLTVNL